ncbi:MAG: hypothetical protein OEM05_19000 [Myxococcales bacterium]|nr:hypothetical protein [Myxococcales bacterium]
MSGRISTILRGLRRSWFPTGPGAAERDAILPAQVSPALGARYLRGIPVQLTGVLVAHDAQRGVFTFSTDEGHYAEIPVEAGYQFLQLIRFASPEKLANVVPLEIRP